MSFSERAAARAEVVAARRRDARIAEIADQIERSGVRVETEREAVVLSGRGLARRWLDDARLRFAAEVGR